MRITIKQLKRVIREESQRALKEIRGPRGPSTTARVKQFLTSAVLLSPDRSESIDLDSSSWDEIRQFLDDHGVTHVSSPDAGRQSVATWLQIMQDNELDNAR